MSCFFLQNGSDLFIKLYERAYGAETASNAISEDASLENGKFKKSITV